ncbi:MAG: hypothetical protein IPO86_10165 [Saprospiraceae bacterium]|nr:hypothetical protein [Saprospiraceae bacterium]MBK9728471.1 hypothetical protein [Saprospiraceae bacterium]
MEIFEINRKANPDKQEVLVSNIKINQPFLIRGIKENILLFTQVEKLAIKFEGCIFAKNVFYEIDLSKFKMRNLSISFSNCFIHGDDRAYSNKINTFESYEIHISYFNCILENISLDNLEFTHLSVFNSIITKNYFSVRNCNINSIQFYNVLGKYGVNRSKESNINVSFGDVNLYLPSKAIKDAYQEISQKFGSIFSFPTSILITEPKKLYIEFKLSSGSGFKKSYLGYHYRLKNEEIKGLDISFNIQTENDTTDSIVINKAILEGIELSNFSKAKIEILRSKINKVFIRDLGFSSLKIYDLSSRVKESSVFESRNVDLSNATFDKTNLSAYEIVSFYRSTLTDINFISPKFPNEIHVLENIHHPDKKEEGYYKMQSENYRQIKNSLVDSGNQIEALEIHSKMYSSLQKDKTLSKEDRAILFLNKESNSHGVSIIRPFFILLILAFITFFLYRTSLNEAPYDFGFKSFRSCGQTIWANIVFVFDDFRVFWLLIDPTHKLSTLESLEPESSLNSASLFFSYFSRIIMAWIMYQFIISFRKFGRKL